VAAVSHLLLPAPASTRPTMNPQINYTPQQQMGYGGYSVPCRTGNWAEDEYLGVLNTQEHFAKEATGMLASQKLSTFLGTAMTPVTLSPAPGGPDFAVRFGDRVMLSAASGGVVAIDSSNRSELPQESYIVTRTTQAAAVPCTRTAWTITPVAEGGPPPEDGMLRFGMAFALAATANDGTTLYLQSQRYTLHNQNYAGTGGSGAGVVVVPKLSADTMWKVAVLDPTDLAQLGSRGQPVPANTFIQLTHCNTCINLFTSEKVVKNKFNGEFLVSAHTATSIVKGIMCKRTGSPVDVGNHFAFTTAEAA